MIDPTCPRCVRTLTKRTTQRGLLYACERCGGLALAMPVLRKVADPAQIDALWTRIKKRAVVPAFGGAECPACTQTMGRLTVENTNASVEIDVCRSCHFLWLDRDELAAFGNAPPASAPQPDPRSLRAGRVPPGTTEPEDWNSTDGRDPASVFWAIVECLLNAIP
jgi:Zn-finger nucleic acid-binding protein